MTNIIFDEDIKTKIKNAEAFFCDIDGTLITPDCALTENTICQVQRIKNRIAFVLASGRNVSGILPFYKTLELDTPIVTLNGSVVFDKELNVILSTKMKKETAKFILDYLMGEFKGKASISAFFGDKWSTDDFDNEYIKKEIKAVQFNPNNSFESINELPVGELNKILFMGRKEDCDKVVEKLLPFKDELHVIHNYDTYVEIFSNDADKGKAVLFVCKKLGIDPNKAITAGDTLIDQAMLEALPYRIAPENANPIIKEIANIHVPSNREEGIARFIEENL